MIDKITTISPLLVFVGAWLAIGVMLSLISGWYRLAARYPDHPDEPLLRVRRQSGSMGGVSMSGILTLTVCASGLRIGISRLFAPFSRPFLVPWNDVAVARKKWLGWWPLAEFRFGQPMIGRLTISASVADRLGRAAQGRWPEETLPPVEPPRVFVGRFVVAWIVLTSIAAAFFTVAPRLVTPKGPSVPLGIAIVFPAVVVGVGMLIRYFRERDKL